MTLLTQSEAAKALGITRQAVADAVRRGALVPCGTTVSRYRKEPVSLFSEDELIRYRSTERRGRPRKASA